MNDLFVQSFRIDWDKISEDSYVRDIGAFHGLDSFELRSPVTFFVGENGTGKSTLLEAIAIKYGFNPEGGTKNYNFSTYDDYSELCDAIHLSKGYRTANWGYFLRAESFYNVASKEAEYSLEGGVPEELHNKSHGESFLATAEKHFRPNGFYILDEPEAALSPQRQLSLLIKINECVKDGSQFIIVSHSPILLSLPDSEIISFDDGLIHKISYEETESYKLTRLFINNKNEMTRHLFTEPNSFD